MTVIEIANTIFSISVLLPTYFLTKKKCSFCIPENLNMFESGLFKDGPLM